jgi:predicted RNA-binding protein with PIN domain
VKIFDGYNVIGAGGEAGLRLDQEDKEERLIRFLSKYRSRLRKKETFLVVFDGNYGVLARGKKKYRQGGVDVEWAVGESADSLIVRRVRANRNPRGIEVVTSDREVLREIGHARAKGVPSGEFISRAVRETGAEAPEKPEHLSPGEVDEWLELFGDGRNSGGDGSR